MSFHMHTGTYGQPGYLNKRVGSNMAEVGLMAILMAGYAVSGRPESKRVAERWVGPMCVSDKPGERPVWAVDYTYWWNNRVEGMKKVLAVNDKDQHWVQIHTDTIRRGLKIAPPYDHVLQSLCTLYDLLIVQFTGGIDIPAEKVPGIAYAVETVLPFLKENCWHDDVEEVLAVLKLAAEYKQPVVCG